MKTTLILILAAVGLVAQPAAPTKPAPRAVPAGLPKSHKDLKYPPINNIKIPEVTRFQLANGMQVLLVEDHELPTFNASARIRVGSRWEATEKTGLASILGSVMRTGGTTNRKGDDLDLLLDNKGAAVETGIGTTSGSVGIGGLKEDSDLLLSIAADILRNPALPEDKIELAKTEIRDSISRRNDDVGSISGRVASDIIYGKESPYAREAEYDTVDAITRADLIAFHARYFQPESIVLAVWGDFRTEEMKGKIEQAFGGWAKGGNPVPALPDPGVDAGKARGVFVVNKEDLQQSNVALLRLGGQARDPDSYVLRVASQILGGGFNSRLFNKVRSKEGLAYDPYANWGANFDYPGEFIAQASTKTETTMRAVSLIRETLAEFGASPVKDAELQGAKDAILKGFAFNFDSSAKIVNRLADYEYYGYPADYLQKYRDAIAGVTKEDVQRVAQKYLDPSSMAVMLVGKVSAFDAKPDSLGLAVSSVDITIPKPKSQQVAAATADTLQRGKELLLKAKAAHGGAAFDSLTDIETKDKIVVGGGQMELNATTRATITGKTSQTIQAPFGEIVQRSNGVKIWAKTPQGEQEAPMPPDQRQAVVKNPYFLLTPTLLNRVKAQALGKVKFAGGEYEAVQITDPETGADFKLLLNGETGVLAGLQGELNLMGQKFQADTVFGGLKEFDGIKVFTDSKVLRGGQAVLESQTSGFRINLKPADSEFEKP